MASLKVVTDKSASYSAARKSECKVSTSRQLSMKVIDVYYRINSLDYMKGKWGDSNPMGKLNDFEFDGLANNLFRPGRHLMQVKHYAFSVSVHL